VRSILGERFDDALLQCDTKQSPNGERERESYVWEMHNCEAVMFARGNVIFLGNTVSTFALNGHFVSRGSRVLWLAQILTAVPGEVQLPSISRD
jgi:hypothetical protein